MYSKNIDRRAILDCGCLSLPKFLRGLLNGVYVRRLDGILMKMHASFLLALSISNRVIVSLALHWNESGTDSLLCKIPWPVSKACKNEGPLVVFWHLEGVPEVQNEFKVQIAIFVTEIRR